MPPAVYGFLCHLCGNRTLAEDLAQETFLRALQALKSYQFRAPFRAWLFRISVNLYRDERRRSVVRKQMDGDISDAEYLYLSTSEPSPDTMTEKRERSKALHQALERLPEHLRMVIVMRDLQEMGYWKSVKPWAGAWALSNRASSRAPRTC